MNEQSWLEGASDRRSIVFGAQIQSGPRNLNKKKSSLSSPKLVPRKRRIFVVKIITENIFNEMVYYTTFNFYFFLLTH